MCKQTISRTLKTGQDEVKKRFEATTIGCRYMQWNWTIHENACQAGNKLLIN